MQPNTPGQLHLFDQMELTEIKKLLQEKQTQQALPRLYKLAAAYPTNPEINSLIAAILSPSPQVLPQQPYQNFAPQQPLPPPSQNYYQPPSYYQQPNYYQSPTGRQPLPDITVLWLKYFAIWVIPLLAFIYIIYLLLQNQANSYHYYGYDMANATNTFNTMILITIVVFGLVLLGTSIWAGSDAGSARNRFGNFVFGNATFVGTKLNPLTIFLGCILFWGLMFPYYLAIRRRAQIYFGKW